MPHTRVETTTHESVTEGFNSLRPSAAELRRCKLAPMPRAAVQRRLESSSVCLASLYCVGTGPVSFSGSRKTASLPIGQFAPVLANKIFYSKHVLNINEIPPTFSRGFEDSRSNQYCTTDDQSQPLRLLFFRRIIQNGGAW